MAKLTNKQLAQLSHILYDFERAYNYLNAPDVLGIAKPAKTTVRGWHYKVVDPGTCKETRAPEIIELHNHQIGYNIAGFEMALSGLINFIECNIE